MPEAVIVATARSPIGRAIKGSLVDVRPDDLAAQIVDAVLDKVPELPRDRDRRPDDGLRPAGGRAGLQHRPGRGDPGRPRRRPRRHRQPLLLVVAADHPHGRARHQGGRGRRLHRRRRRERVSRLRAGSSDTAPRTRLRRRRAQRTSPGRRRPGRRGRRRRACPTSTSPWGRPPRTWPSSRASPARRWTSSPCCRSSGRWPRMENGLLRAGDHAGDAARRHGRVHRRRPAARHHRRGAGRAEAGLPARRRGHRRQRLPAQRRRRRRGRDERHQGPGARHHAARPHRRRPASPALNPEIMGLGPIEACRQALDPGRHDDRRHRPRRDQRGVRRAGHPVGARSSASTGTS